MFFKNKKHSNSSYVIDIFDGSKNDSFNEYSCLLYNQDALMSK